MEGTAMPDREHFLTSADVADRLQVPERAVKRNIRAGRLEGYVFPLGPRKHAWRVSPSALEDFLKRTHAGQDAA